MKPSELPKDGNFSGRINKQVLKELKQLGMTPQKIIDAYIDSVLKAEVQVKAKYTGK